MVYHDFAGNSSMRDHQALESRHGSPASIALDGVSPLGALAISQRMSFSDQAEALLRAASVVVMLVMLVLIALALTAAAVPTATVGIVLAVVSLLQAVVTLVLYTDIWFAAFFSIPTELAFRRAIRPDGPLPGNPGNGAKEQSSDEILDDATPGGRGRNGARDVIEELIVHGRCSWLLARLRSGLFAALSASCGSLCITPKR
jgi:hypothetical protein